MLQEKLQALEKGINPLDCAVIKQSETLKMLSFQLTSLEFAFGCHIIEFRMFPLSFTVAPMSAMLSYCQHSDKVQEHLYQRQVGTGDLTLGNFQYLVNSSEADFSLFIFYDTERCLVSHAPHMQCYRAPKFRQTQNS